jgi:hypothetical protein
MLVQADGATESLPGHSSSRNCSPPAIRPAGESEMCRDLPRKQWVTEPKKNESLVIVNFLGLIGFET